ncbi:MAG: PEP-CTERM sorting domain-containing protein [Verrucomicrobium sp.]
MKNYRLLTLLLCLLAALPWAAAQAQVTYSQRAPTAADFTNLGSNGATLTLHFDLQGSPAQSPLGATFSILVTFSPIESADSTPRSDLQFEYKTGFIPGIYLDSSSSLQVSDLGVFSSSTGVPATLPPQYTFTVDMGDVPATPGWTMESDGFGIGSSAHGTYRPSDGAQGLSGLIAPSPFYTPYGSAADIGAYFLTNEINPALVLSSINVNETSLGIVAMDITFTPVPEPGGALLVMAGGLLLLARRRSRRA